MAKETATIQIILFLSTHVQVVCIYLCVCVSVIKLSH